jgi:ElaB/YqjD/DUF883 family membrane-anchored ribosome-binding protein
MLLEMTLEGPLFDLRDSNDYDQNPMVYVGGLSLTAYTVRAYAPLPVRVEAMRRHLTAVPDFLRTGLGRLDPEVPRPFIELAIAMAKGIESSYRDVERVVQSVGEAAVGRIREVRDPAVRAVQSFAHRLHEEWLPRATDQYALGADRYQKLLWVRERVQAPFADLLAAGRADLERNQTRLRAIAAATHPPTDGRGLLDRAAKDHPTADQLLTRAREFVDTTKTFVREKELATIPEPALCRVEETPGHHRALSTASMNPPGPFDTTGEEGIYFVTPADPGWSPETQEEWLRSFNDAVLRNITVHEVYPGHYLQFLHFRRAAGSLSRKTFLSNAFVEGWAHYTEQLALEQGLGGGGPEAEAAQLHDALLRDCRLIVSVGLHTQGMSLAEAATLFEREAFCEPIVARREAERGTYDPAYFGYTLGKLAILDARRKHLETRFGGSLRAFHDRVLAFGAPPVGFLEELLQGS